MLPAITLLATSGALLDPGSLLANSGGPGSTTRRHVTRGSLLRAATLSFGAALLPPTPLAHADDGVTIGQIPASGIIFKDIVKVERIEDPKVTGVELYVSDFQRPITDRLSKDFFSDPAQAAVTCVRTGPMELAEDINATPEGEEVFSQARSLLFKSVNVRRLYDADTGTISEALLVVASAPY